MKVTPARSHVHLLPLGFAVLAIALLTSVLALSTRDSAAQNADTDADGYADELEAELGSSPTDPDNTPEHFALLWTCTDGNDNDQDGKRDFIDPGCRNTVPGTSPTAAPTPAPTPPPANSGGGSGGGSSGGGSSGSGENVVLGGSGAPISDGTSGSEGSGAGAAGDSGGSVGDGSGAGTEAAAADSTAADAAGAAGAGDESASGEGSGEDGFPWMISLLILLGGLAAAAIAYALGAHRESRPAGNSGRY